MIAALRADLREMVREQVEFRELLWQMTKRDLLLRYKQTVMGFAWALFMPLLNTLVFSTIFTRVAPIDVGMPYALYAFTGLLAWNFFASSLRFATISLSSNAPLVSKVYFPREVFPLTQVAVCLIDTLAAGVVLVALMGWYGYWPHAGILWLPVVIVAHLLLTLSCAMMLAMSNLFYRDVKYLADVVLSVAMFSTTALYPASLAGGRVAVLMEANPMSIIIDGYRHALFGRVAPEPLPLLVTCLASGALLIVTWLAFHRSEYRFAESV